MAPSSFRLIDFARVFSRVPPWITLPSAVASYFVCHHYATAPSATVVVSANAAGDAAAAAIVRALAIVFQFLVPLCLTMSAATWLRTFLERRHFKRLAERAADADIMAGLTWEAFEQVAAEGFASMGFDVQLTSEGADGGYDFVLTREGRRYLVQAKHWHSAQVGVDVARSLYGILQAEQADGAYLVTSGQFTRAAAHFAAGKPLWLYSGQRLRDLLLAGRHESSAGMVSSDRLALPVPADSVTCPLCSGAMILREAKRGRHAGKHFYGCSQYPACSGLRAVD